MIILWLMLELVSLSPHYDCRKNLHFELVSLTNKLIIPLILFFINGFNMEQNICCYSNYYWI